jgi:hypothetical protein
MTRDEIIRMAREAGINEATSEFYCDEFGRMLAAAREAEAVKWIKGAKISVPTATMEQHFSAYHRRGYEAGKALIPAAVAAEREACAKICDQRKRVTPEWILDQHYNQAASHCAAAIRARVEA